MLESKPHNSISRLRNVGEPLRCEHRVRGGYRGIGRLVRSQLWEWEDSGESYDLLARRFIAHLLEPRVEF